MKDEVGDWELIASSGVEGDSVGECLRLNSRFIVESSGGGKEERRKRAAPREVPESDEFSAIYNRNLRSLYEAVY